jgi:hypothetical protein
MIFHNGTKKRIILKIKSNNNKFSQNNKQKQN